MQWGGRRSQLSQLPLASIEARHRQRVTPIDSQSSSRPDHSLVTGNVLLDRSGCRERRREALLGKQLCEPQLIQ